MASRGPGALRVLGAAGRAVMALRFPVGLREACRFECGPELTAETTARALPPGSKPRVTTHSVAAAVCLYSEAVALSLRVHLNLSQTVST
jgi:hypothetical protein